MMAKTPLLSLVSAFALAGMLTFVAAPAAHAQAPAEITEEGVIVGTMTIDFGTRTNLDTSGDLKQGSAAIGAKDSYKLDINVAKTTDFTGEVTRQPKLFSSVLGRTKQDGRLYYNINLGVRSSDGKQKAVVGKWVGEVPLDPKTGVYDLAGGKANETPLRFAVEQRGQMQAYTDFFAGRLVGKAEKKESLGATVYKRVVGGKEVKIEVKKADPMKFQGVELAKGPAASNYPRVIVNGQMDFDYETSNWMIPEQGITFSYNVGGTEINDKMTGSIKWVEDANYATNGKGYYEFNLRFNEEKNKKGQTEDAAFKQMSDEDAFFAVDTTVPALTGRIEYVDSFVSGSESVSASKVTYKLNANKLTKAQVVNFFKLWLICVGPTNDD
jgi:hypothetical protein